MLRLPNLSGLSLACKPCGIPVDRWEDVPDQEKVQNHPNRDNILRTTTCLICGGDIERNTDLGPDPDTRDLEVLVELPCGHAFHRSCLAGVVRTGQARCPGPDRDMIPQGIINRLGGNAVSGQEAALGPYDPNSGLDYNDNPPITSGNRGNAIDPADEAVYDYPDPELIEITTDVYNRMNELIRSWSRPLGQANNNWANGQRNFIRFWTQYSVELLESDDAYETIVAARRLILRTAREVAPRIRGWTQDRDARLQLLMELADVLWEHFHESGNGGTLWQQLGRPDDPLLDDDTLGVQWVGFIQRYPELGYNDQQTNTGFGRLCNMMRAILSNMEGLYEPIPEWLDDILQDAVSTATAITQYTDNLVDKEISTELNTATYRDAFDRLLKNYAQLTEAAAGFSRASYVPVWILEWFQVVLFKFHNGIIDVKYAYTQQSDGTLGGGANRNAVRAYTYTSAEAAVAAREAEEAAGLALSPSNAPDDSDDDGPPSPVYDLQNGGWLIPPRN